MAGSRDFGKIINERRLSLGYSLGQLANRMGTTATKVRSWERGDAVPDDATLDQLAEELNMSAGVLRATLPETEPPVDAPGDVTSVVAAPVSAEVDDTADELDTGRTAEDETHPPIPDGVDAEAAEAAGAIIDEAGAESEEAQPEEPQPEGSAEELEATAVVAAVAADAAEAEPAEDSAAAQADVEEPEAELAESDEEDDTDEQQALLDAPTEAVEVVPTGPPAEPSGGLVAAPAMVATATPRVDLTDVGIPEPSGIFAPVERFMAVIFDPDKSYLTWIRLILILIVFFVFLRILSWAVPEFFDALKDILDTIESTPSEPGPGTGFIEGLGRVVPG